MKDDLKRIINELYQLALADGIGAYDQQLILGAIEQLNEAIEPLNNPTTE